MTDPTTTTVTIDLLDHDEDCWDEDCASECLYGDPMEGGPWTDDNPAHRPVVATSGIGWRCICDRFTGHTLRAMRTHADRHPATDETKETDR